MKKKHGDFMIQAWGGPPQISSFPLILILIGVLWTASKLGLFSEGLFWPVVLIMLGVIWLIKDLLQRRYWNE